MIGKEISVPEPSSAAPVEVGTGGGTPPKIESVLKYWERVERWLKGQSWLRNKKVMALAGGAVVILLILVLAIKILMSQNVNSNGASNAGDDPVGVSAGKPSAYFSGTKIYLFTQSSNSYQPVADLTTVMAGGVSSVEIRQPKWHVDGQLLVFILEAGTVPVESSLVLFNSSNGSVVEVFRLRDGSKLVDFDWVPGTKDVIIAYSDEKSSVGDKKTFRLDRLSVLGFATRENILSWARPIQQVVVAPSAFIYLLDGEGDLWRAPLGERAFTTVLQGVNWFDLSRDGRKLVYGRIADGEVWVSLESGANAHQVTRAKSNRGESSVFASRVEPKWSPDGRRIAFLELGVNYRGLGIINEDGTGLRSIEENPISPQIKVGDRVREIGHVSWSGANELLFISLGGEEEVSDDLYRIDITNESYQKLAEDVQNYAWGR